MKATTLLIGAFALSFTPAHAIAQNAPGNHSNNSSGSNHSNGPTSTGQPNQSCQLVGTTPGDAADAPGSAFNPDGKAGTRYAGQQPQNSRNSASVSQYDVACANQPG